MDGTQILLVLTAFICGLLTGYLVGTKKDHGFSKQKDTLPDKEICLHETAVVRTDGRSIEGSLLICEKCGADYGNFGTSLDNRVFKRTKI